jgi:hypothetical protein
MLYRIAAGFMLLIGGVALLCVGAGYAGYALYAAFLPLVGTAWASLITAGFLFFLPLLSVLLIAALARRRRRNSFADLPPTSPENIVLAFLSGWAKDRPVLALAVAGLLGAAATWLRRKKK